MKLIGKIDRIEGLSREQFFKQYFAKKPVVMAGLLSDWPALKLWSNDYLSEICGDYEVGIGSYDPDKGESGLEALFGEWQSLSLSKYLESLKSIESRYSMRENRFILKDNPKLLEDVNWLAPLCEKELVEQDETLALWLGPKGYETGLHIDDGHGQLFQVRGRKHFRYLAPDQTPLLYEDDLLAALSSDKASHVSDEEKDYWAKIMRLSPVDPFRPDFKKFPKISDAGYYDAYLDPGDVVYTPTGWWHAVRSIDASISVTAYVEGG